MTRRNQVLFLVALLGVLTALGTLAHELGGGALALGYAVVAAGLLVAGAARARAVEAARRRAAGRTCSCCTATHFDPVEVV